LWPIPKRLNPNPAFTAKSEKSAFQIKTLPTPFAMTNFSQFRPGPPPALSSALYATDFNETKLMGRIDSTNRTSDETQLALLWQAVGPVDENRIARSLVPFTNSLVDNARLFALVNIAAADAIIAGFDSKYTYNFWRPYHAIRLADTNSNPGTVPDPAWNSLFLPPRFQEYMSNHASVTSAFMTILASLLGDTNTFTLAAPGYPSFTWSFNKFSDAIAQVKEARIWAGIHFRNSCNVGQTQGTALANYVATNFLLPAPRPSSAVMDPSATYEGKTYAQWSASWWQWFYSLPTDRHPLFDTADVSAGQSGNVWFLGGAYNPAATNGVKYGTAAARDVVIPQGTALYFPLFAAESAILEGKGTNAAGLQANSQAVIDTVTMLSCAIDGQTVSNLSAYRASSSLFTWGPLPTNNVFGDPVNFPAGATSPSVADGYYLLLQPMTPGDHSIHFNGGTPRSQIDITYNITITPTNGVYPPGSTMFGKTYSEWSGAFFQYFFSLPATNNPFHYDSAHPSVPLGTGQNGPVWFVHGYRNLTGTYTRNDAIPAGTSLLLVPVDLFWDNTACPSPTTYTPVELLGFLTNYVNGATNMQMKVDGVSVADISDALTTPFRVQTIYDYTAPAFDNMIAIDENEPCYQNNQGRPYTVTGAAGDGVVLMIPPLSPGSHTISYQLTLSTTSPVYHWNMTEYITVQPIMPTLAVSHHDGILSLTWPQGAVNYTVEMTSSLNPPNWQPANLPVSALAGIYQMTAPTGTGSQFFRLRPH
jgi:hypothetical protein